MILTRSPYLIFFQEYFTVEELTTYTARLKRRVIDTDQDLADRVEELLHILGLADVRKKRPGRLTGGQRKRVSIGLGLVSKPRILFLDEPTTVCRGLVCREVAGLDQQSHWSSPLRPPPPPQT